MHGPRRSRGPGLVTGDLTSHPAGVKPLRRGPWTRGGKEVEGTWFHPGSTTGRAWVDVRGTGRGTQCTSLEVEVSVVGG